MPWIPPFFRHFILIFVNLRKNNIRWKHETLLGYFSIWRPIRISKNVCFVTSVVAVIVVKNANNLKKWGAHHRCPQTVPLIVLLVPKRNTESFTSITSLISEQRTYLYFLVTWLARQSLYKRPIVRCNLGTLDTFM